MWNGTVIFRHLEPLQHGWVWPAVQDPSSVGPGAAQHVDQRRQRGGVVPGGGGVLMMGANWSTVTGAVGAVGAVGPARHWGMQVERRTRSGQ